MVGTTDSSHRCFVEIKFRLGSGVSKYRQMPPVRSTAHPNEPQHPGGMHRSHVVGVLDCKYCFIYIYICVCWPGIIYIYIYLNIYWLVNKLRQQTMFTHVHCPINIVHMHHHCDVKCVFQSISYICHCIPNIWSMYGIATMVNNNYVDLVIFSHSWYIYMDHIFRLSTWLYWVKAFQIKVVLLVTKILT